MASFLQYKTNGIQWAVWKMEESLDALLALLPDARRVFCEQDLNRFVSERRKMEWLSVRVLLYAMLQEDKEIGYSPEGKPYLTDHSFFISISHTKGYAAVCWHPSRAVSIDIEMIRPKALSLKERFVHPDEQVEGDEVHASLLLWSMKETLFKIIDNQEAVNFRSHLFINPFKISSEGMSYGLDRRNPDMLYKLDYWVDSDFVLTRIG